MAKAATRTFSAVLTKTNSALRWVVIWIPFNAARIWGVRGPLKVKGTINDFAFRATLFPGGGGRHYLVVNRQMQKGGGVAAGMKASFCMEPDLDRPPDPVPELDQALGASRRLQQFFRSLPLSIRNYVTRPISTAKQAETRRRRAEHAAEQLLELMEAEVEMPPLIRQAFARRPKAAAAWRDMSPSRRRWHLFGIFYYRNPETRLRRLERAMKEIEGEAKHPSPVQP
jgi:uncharacterized protein YdeI (YjbR/CyaY-like superfamily)